MKIKGLMLVAIIGITNLNLAMAGTCMVGHHPGSGPTAITQATAASMCPSLCQKEGMPYVGGWVNNGSFSTCPCLCDS